MVEINRYVLHSKDCGDAFERMAWACFWVLDARIGIDGVRIDLLPDFIGWMMMVSALTQILDLSPVVSKLRIYASILLIFSLFDIVEVGEGGSPAFASPGYVWDLVSGLLLLVLIWGVGGLIKAMAEAVGDRDIASKAHLYRNIYWVLVFLPLVLPLQFLRPPELLFLVGMAILGLAFVTWLLIMKLLMDTSKLCRGLM